ncbi:MAG: hypothetical protein QXT26_03400 [Thermoproteota archaeon]
MSEKGRKSGVLIVFMVVALAVLIIALITLLWEYVFQGTYNPINMILSIGTILLSLYFILQIIRKPQNLFFETYKATTVIRCVNCNYVSARGFEKEDYILKEVGVCPGCGDNLIIYSIFREAKDKKYSE